MEFRDSSLVLEEEEGKARELCSPQGVEGAVVGSGAWEKGRDDSSVSG